MRGDAVLPRAAWTRGPPWRSLFVAAMLMLAGAFATADAWTDMARIAWRDDEQSHAFLVPVVAGFLFWVRRGRLRGHAVAATWAGPALAAVGWLCYRTGDAQMVQSLWHGGAILVVVGGLVAVTGGGFVLRFLPAFAALCFLIPVPGRVREAIAIPLQAATARATQALLEVMGEPVERWGNTLRVNGEDVTIAEACNGLRMVFALVMVTFTFAYGVPLRNGVRVLVLAATPVVAIAVNVVRLTPTVWAYGHLSPGTAESIHDIGAWLMPPCAFMTLIGLTRLLRWAQVPVTPYVHAFGS